MDPEKRYPTPIAMLTEVQAALQRLESGHVDEKQAPGHVVMQVDAEAAKEGLGKTVMVVESRVELQDLLRERLKSRGYRVLVFSDPTRALDRFTQDDSHVADCVVISATDLGPQALEAFNRLVETEYTAQVPVVMLVDPKQQNIIRSAKRDDRHILLPMPLKVRDLRTALMKLIVPQESH
jgi:serine/threonine-protein kinase